MKTLLITGATCELGRAICRRFIKKSYRLILTAPSQERLHLLSEELKKEGGEVFVTSSDFTDINSFLPVINTIESIATDGLDGLIIIPPQPEATKEVFPNKIYWDLLFNKSFIGPVVFLGQLMPYLIKRGKANIVLISGISSRQPVSNYATSNTIRTAWLGFSKTIADNYGPKGIRFNTLSLGGIMTKKFEQQLENEANKANQLFSDVLEQRCANVPLRRYAEIPEIVEMIIFLITSIASKHITGQNIIFDGGFTRAY